MRKRTAIAALILLIVPTFLIPSLDPVDVISPVLAAGKGKQGNNGNGNGNGGNSNNLGNGPNSADDAPESANIGDDFRNEGFASPQNSDRGLALGNGAKIDPEISGIVGPGDSKNKENWSDLLGLGKKFSLDFLKGSRGGEVEFGRDLDRDHSAKENHTDHSGLARGLDPLKHGAKQDKVEGSSDDQQQQGVRPAKDGGPLLDISIAVPQDLFASREVLALYLGAASIDRIRELGFEIDSSYVSPDDGALARLTAPGGLGALEALALLRRELPAEHFHLNRLYRPYRLAMGDERAKGESTEAKNGGKVMPCADDRCYGRSAIQWSDNLAHCGRDLAVGVIDTDADLQHPTFAGQKITQKSFLPVGRHPSSKWHGTGVLALLAGGPGSGTPGLIHESNFFLASIFFANDDGEPVTDTVSLLAALDWMRASRARLVNMSFSGPQDNLVQARIQTMRAEGFVFVAAVGNEGPAAPPAFPAAYPEVIAVTAVNKDLRIYPSANRGAQIDFAAPGVRIWTAMPNAREGYRSGTSFAVPFATAVLALQPENRLSGPKKDLLAHVKTIDLGTSGRESIYGRGLLRAPTSCPMTDEDISYLTTSADRQTPRPLFFFPAFVKKPDLRLQP